MAQLRAVAAIDAVPNTAVATMLRPLAPNSSRWRPVSCCLNQAFTTMPAAG
jgi:hypothetical protein